MNIENKLSLNDIKKILYKESPIAKLQYIRKGHAYYKATINSAENNNKNIDFEIPISDMGDADFHAEMNGKHLIRWILNLD